MSRKQRRSLGSFASKYATRPPPPPPDTPAITTSPDSTLSATASPFIPAPDSAQAQAPTPATAPEPSHAPEPVIISGTISLADLLAPLAPPPAQKPLFELDIELIPGVTTLLPVYETDNYTSLVKEFAAKHQLSVAPEAERMFANKIQQMAMELGKLQSQQS